MRILLHPLGRSVAALLLLALLVAEPLVLRTPRAAAAQAFEITRYFGPLPITADDIARLSFFNASEDLDIPFELTIGMSSTGVALATISGIAAPQTGGKLDLPGSAVPIPPGVAEDLYGKIRTIEIEPTPITIPNLKFSIDISGHAVATFTSFDGGTLKAQVTCEKATTTTRIRVKE